MDMGFARVRAEKALILTQNVDAEVAVGWLMEHQEDTDIDEPLQIVGSAAPSVPAVNLDELDEDARVLYDEMMKKKAKEQGSKGRLPLPPPPPPLPPLLPLVSGPT